MSFESTDCSRSVRKASIFTASSRACSPSAASTFQGLIDVGPRGIAFIGVFIIRYAVHVSLDHDAGCLVVIEQPALERVQGTISQAVAIVVNGVEIEAEVCLLVGVRSRRDEAAAGILPGAADLQDGESSEEKDGGQPAELRFY